MLKKAGLDSSLPTNYRPICNLSAVSKVLERLVLARLQPHLLGSSNFSKLQSVCRNGHSTETALLEVLEYLDVVFTAADDKQVTVLIDLDLSAAFDTVDHRLIFKGRTQYVSMGQHQSAAVEVDVGVPQGSVLGPLLFVVY